MGWCPGWAPVSHPGLAKGGGQAGGCSADPGRAGSGHRAASRSLPRTPSLPALTQWDASWPGHPASLPAPAHRLPGLAASAEPTPLRHWGGHPMWLHASCVGTASPTAQGSGSQPPQPLQCHRHRRGRGRFGSWTQWAAAELASRLGWGMHGGGDREGAAPSPGGLLALALAWHGTAWHIMAHRAWRVGSNRLGTAQPGEPQPAAGTGPSPPALAPAPAPASGVDYTQRDLALNLPAEQR